MFSRICGIRFVMLVCIGVFTSLCLMTCGKSDNDSASQTADAGGMSPEAAAGAAIFKIQCASCHGDAGKGDGVAAAGLKVKPRNLTLEPYKYVDIKGSPSEVDALVAYIKAGRLESGMPSFAFLPEKDIRALAEYVRSLRPKPNFVDEKK